MTDPALQLRAAVREVPDFPKPGIRFMDITPILADGGLFRMAVGAICERLNEGRIDKIVGIDARGFLFAAAVADRLGVGMVPVRKQGKLPWKTRQASYALEYGEAVIEVHEDAIQPGERVWIIDDLLATGGTAEAAVQLLRSLGAEVCGVAVLIALEFLPGRARLEPCRVEAVISEPN